MTPFRELVALERAAPGTITRKIAITGLANQNSWVLPLHHALRRNLRRVSVLRDGAVRCWRKQKRPDVVTPGRFVA